MPSTAVEFVQGTQYFLTAKLTGVLSALNADLAAKVTTGAAPVFKFCIGEIPNASECRLCTAWIADDPNRVGDREKIVAVTFKILCLVPVAGDNRASSFEVARQVSHDHVQTLLDDDGQMLNPTINAGLIGNVTGEAERGRFFDIFPRLMADKVTYCRGWEVSYTAQFSLRTR